MVAALLWAIPSPASLTPSGDAQPPAIKRVKEVLPEARSLKANINGRWTIYDSTGEVIGEVARTLPQAQDVVGYRGPSESMVVMDQELRVLGVRLLQSADTHEHVDAVIGDHEFFRQFDGWSWNEPPIGDRVDAVSGATLTSLALAEGVLKRMKGGTIDSLVFANELTVADVSDWFSDASTLKKTGSFYVVKDAAGTTLGRVLRTGPFSDDIVGYQGPTELLMQIGEDGRVVEMRIRESFDNEPYVDYVRDDKYSWTRLADRTLPELAALDPAEERIEGVSGATMTSLAVADTAIESAKRVVAAEAEAAKPKPTMAIKVIGLVRPVRWTSRDLLTIATLVLAALLSQKKWFRLHGVRRAWLVWVIAVIGLWAGNLISMALVAGWSAEGVAWQLAPGLAMIAIAALMVPPLTKGNPYCNHLCPHGAVQQLIKPSTQSKRKWHPSPRISKWLGIIPGVTLVVAYLAIIFFPTIDLSSWEPFHAYLFRIAGWSAIGLCALTLAIAMFVPMGYCRLGCPTGRLIDYLRRTARSDRVEFADGVAAALLVTAMAMKI